MDMQASLPAGTRVIDHSQRTVLPGLIDAHVHITGAPDQAGYRSLGISVPPCTPSKEGKFQTGYD